VDRSRTRIWKPLLLSIAAGSLRRSQQEADFLVRALSSHFRDGNRLDRAGRTIALPARPDGHCERIEADRAWGDAAN
jgi:NADH dehydrogenase